MSSVQPSKRIADRIRKLVPLGLVAVAVVLVGLVARMPNEAPPNPATEVPPVNVEVHRIGAIAELADTFDLTAVVEANRVVKVAAEVAGRIESIGRRPCDRTWRARPFREGAVLDEGEPVAEGDPIVHLNEDLLQARFDRAKAQLDFDEVEYERIRGLYQDATASKTELDDRRTKRDVSKATLAEAREQLERATIVAPISGILNCLPMEIGEYAAPGDCVAEIVDIDRVKIVVDVPERDVHYLKVGDGADVFVRAPEDATLAGSISYISELSDDSTRTTRVEITVDNRDHRLRSGQIVRTRLTRRVLNDVIMIPLGAVIPLENGKAVYIVNPNGQAERRTVELGFLKGRKVRILDGLDVGDRLIVSGHRYVGPGQPVAIVGEQ